ncbi:hypothetical protein BCY84_17788 [Trypanosoma cruzi cruzi]|nr:hypothetical protein BCY84_17788 [Trypanosoma cruzi cruzi]
MKLRLFGGMDCPDSVLARLAVAAAVEPVAAAKMSDHAVTILLLTTHGDARETDSDGLGVLDVQNKLFFSQREMMEIGVARMAQALTAIHTVVLNIVKYDVSENDAVRELGILGLSEESAAAVVSPVHTHRMELASALLRQTPRVSFGCFGSLDGETSAVVILYMRQDLVPVTPCRSSSSNNNKRGGRKKKVWLGICTTCKFTQGNCHHSHRHRHHRTPPRANP